MASCRPKPVFPLLYFSAFLFTVIGLFMSFYSAGPPPIVQAVDGAINQQTFWVTVQIFAISLSVYLVAHYVNLELFEGQGQIDTQLGRGTLILETMIRMAVVAVVTMKVLKWSLFDDIFLFVAVISALLLVWYGILCVKNIVHVGEEHVPKKVVFGHLVVFLLAAISIPLTGSAAKQIEFAVPLLIVLFLIALLLFGFSLYVAYSTGRTALKVVQQYVSRYSPVEDEL